MSRPRTPPGSYGDISITLVERKTPADVDLFKSVRAPDSVIEWARQNPDELMKLVAAATRRNRKVQDVYQAETRYRPRSGGSLRKVRGHGETEKKARDSLLAKLAGLNAFEAATGSHGLTPQSTMNALLDRYEEIQLGSPREGLEQQTIDNKKRVIRRAIRPRIGGLSISEFRGVQADDFALELLDDGKKHDYKEARIILNDAMTLARRYELISINPMEAALKAPRRSRRQVQEDVVILTHEQVDAMRRALVQWERDRRGKPGPAPSPVYRYFFDVLVGTGTRISEALALRVQDVVLGVENPFVLISGTIVEHVGKGVQRQPYPKGKRPSAKALPTAAARALAAQLARLGDREPEDLVFPTRKRTPISYGNMRRSLGRASDLIKAIDADFVFYPHLTRKTAATAVHGRLGDEKTAGFLSHADLSSLPHYVKAVLPEADIDVVPVLEDLLPVLDVNDDL